jgi:hypothetical protein
LYWVYTVRGLGGGLRPPLPATLLRDDLSGGSRQGPTRGLLILLLAIRTQRRELLLDRDRVVSSPQLTETTAPLAVPVTVGCTLLLGYTRTEVHLRSNAVTNYITVITAVKQQWLRGRPIALLEALDGLIKGDTRPCTLTLTALLPHAAKVVTGDRRRRASTGLELGVVHTEALDTNLLRRLGHVTLARRSEPLGQRVATSRRGSDGDGLRGRCSSGALVRGDVLGHSDGAWKRLGGWVLEALGRAWSRLAVCYQVSSGSSTPYKPGRASFQVFSAIPQRAARRAEGYYEQVGQGEARYYDKKKPHTSQQLLGYLGKYGVGQRPTMKNCLWFFAISRFFFGFVWFFVCCTWFKCFVCCIWF